MLTDNYRKPPLDDHVRRFRGPDHDRRTDVITTAAAVTLTVVLLVGPRLLTATELAARRRVPPPRISSSPVQRAGDHPPDCVQVRAPGGPALAPDIGLVGSSSSSVMTSPPDLVRGGLPSIGMRLIPTPRRALSSRSGHATGS